MLENQEAWLLCADPDSRQIYTINTETNQINIETDVPQEYRKRAYEAIDGIEKLIHLNTGNWLCVSQEVDKYRRRPIPSYLLHKQSSSVALYLSQSTLSLAFAETKSLHLKVYLSQYDKQLNPGQDYVEIDAAIVTSADEVIKLVIQRVFEVTQVQITPTSNSQFVLQVRGLREFITGSNPLLYFDRVRSCLRGLKTLEVSLTDVKKDQNKDLQKYNQIHIYVLLSSTGVPDNFPPIAIRTKNTEVLEPVDWEYQKNVALLLWYPPIPLPSYSEQIQDIIFSVLSSIKTMKCEHKQPNNKKDINEYVKLEQMRQRDTQRQNEDNLYSGECDYPFKVKVLGIDRIIQLFEHDFVGLKNFRATYNGIMPLQFITKEDAKPQLQHNISKKQERSSSLGDTPKNIKPTPLKLTNKSVNQASFNLNHPSQMKFVAFGGVEYGAFKRILQERYGLDFIPYLLSVRVALYHGSRLLTDWCSVETRQIPFSTQPILKETITFKGIKISLLPLESRLCFNVLVYGNGGQSQIIGSAYIYLFDYERCFRQGSQILNIWPFCRVDPRLQCMTQYWGMATSKVPEQSKLSEYVDNHFGRLIVEMDTFCNPMLYSLRCQDRMQQLGMAKNANSLSYYSMILTYDQVLLNQLRLQKKKSQKDNKKDPKDSKRIQKKKILIINIKNKLDNLQQKTGELYDQVAQSFEKKKILTKEEQYAKIYPYDKWERLPTTEKLAYTQILLNVSPINRPNFSKFDKYTLMRCRKHLSNIPNAFQVFFLAIDWADPQQIREGHKLIKQWVPMNHENSLPLLDAHYPDGLVRLKAVQNLSELHDDDLSLYMLELTQALMFEKNILNPLTEMLLERSLANPWVVGHELFWLLRSQLHVKPSYERFALILEQMLMLAGNFRLDLLNEVLVNDQMQELAESVKECSSDQRNITLYNGLKSRRKLLPPVFSFALDSRLEVTDFRMQKCKILDSKKLPLWLVADSAYGGENENNFTHAAPPIIIIFKTGDDMRQDLLTLQLIRIMDKIWLDSGFDFRMKPYKVIATKDQVGIIEVVLASETVSKIHHDAGALGAFDHASIQNFLKQKNPTYEAFEAATENFIRSCAGYCVATYILGIGDRHSGNIMLCETGHLFHIDFGHFLGNFKSKFGFKRERTAFVLTMEMAYVMGGQNSEIFERFEQYCTDAYNMVRKHGTFLTNIFMMNLSAGMPELQKATDVKYLQDQLAMTLSEQEATALFRSQIKNSISDQWRKIDNFIHNLKRKG